MNIILIGFRGTGKSSVAELVAMATNRDVFHMDSAIAELAKCPTAQFVKEKGWEAFWELEQRVAQEAAQKQNTVIDTGGGVIRHEDHMAALKKTGVVFWLTAQPSTIRERLSEFKDRPSITPHRSFLDEVEEVLEAREPFYAQYADHQIPTDNRTLGEIANDIIQIVCGG
ncbi:MAG TPA: shikimate kinase [Candidatus Hydrogenedentes bacterium]|mgnify:CR=1 FL=1|nr:shikimate kinase [Candidatus Hydrogenedentota bacterium]HOL76286.1 shikimate kinase [Candidatus Hydrogenedentota bacterium]HPO86113.1 shikimate kinase [Candidatus Hydrogenedentota bacterium]